jgi:hypothetical protein
MNPDIETLLAQDLRELTRHQVPGPDLDAITRRGRALRRRRMGLAGVGGATVTAGIAAAVAVALAAGTAGGQTGVPGHPGRLAAGGTPSAVPGHSGGLAAGGTPAFTFKGTPSAAALRAHLTAALVKAVATSKLTVRSTFNGYPSVIVTVPSQNWALETDMYRNGSTMQVKFTSVEPGTGAYAGILTEKRLNLYYDHRKATSQVFYSLNPKWITDATPWHGDEQPESLQPSSWSKVTGTATVDGQPAYVLAQAGSGGYHSKVWVSKKTLLPIKDVVHTYVGTTHDTYIWSAVSGASATAAANTPAIPAGFTLIRSHGPCPTPRQARHKKWTEWGC